MTIELAQGEAIFLSHGNLRLARIVDQLLTKAPDCKCRATIQPAVSRVTVACVVGAAAWNWMTH